MTESNPNRQELERHIASLEDELAFLKTKLAEIEQEQQHDAIDHLDEHLLQVENRWENLKAFWPIAAQELRELLTGSKEEKKRSSP